MPVVTPDIAAGAAVWLARLHGPSRSVDLEREFLAWQSRSDQHRLAFERCTAVWQEVPGIGLADAFSAGGSELSFSRRTSQVAGRRWALALSAAGILALAGVGFMRWSAGVSYGTGIGEQQVVILDDGTRLTLNTSTRVRVNITKDRRSVTVEDGEALFEVAKDPHRPFIVRVRGNEVVALGTMFSVRFTPNQPGASEPAVVLIEGMVTVRPGPDLQTTDSSPAGQLLLHPGERARLASAGAPGQPTSLVDRPSMDQLVAWKRGEALFDDASLDQAVAEMNRYSRTPIVLVDATAPAGHRVSGLFRTGDNLSFARAVAKLHDLVLREYPDRLELAQSP